MNSNPRVFILNPKISARCDRKSLQTLKPLMVLENPSKKQLEEGEHFALIKSDKDMNIVSEEAKKKAKELEATKMQLELIEEEMKEKIQVSKKKKKGTINPPIPKNEMSSTGLNCQDMMKKFMEELESVKESNKVLQESNKVLQESNKVLQESVKKLQESNKLLQQRCDEMNVRLILLEERDLLVRIKRLWKKNSEESPLSTQESKHVEEYLSFLHSNAHPQVKNIKEIKKNIFTHLSHNSQIDKSRLEKYLDIVD